MLGAAKGSWLRALPRGLVASSATGGLVAASASEWFRRHQRERVDVLRSCSLHLLHSLGARSYESSKYFGWRSEESDGPADFKPAATNSMIQGFMNLEATRIRVPRYSAALRAGAAFPTGSRRLYFRRI